MHFIAADGESFFSDEYTLSKLSTEAYIRDPRFELHGMAFKWDANTPAKWFNRDELRDLFSRIHWPDVILCVHHAHFDGFYLNHWYGVRPGKWADTLSMARLIFGNHLSVSLDSVRKYFNIPLKNTPYNLFKGFHWDQLALSTQREVAQGCCDEVESIWYIFGQLAKEFPPDDYEYVDTTIRMFTEPCLQGDLDVLAKLWRDENDAKAERAKLLNVDPKQLRSNDQFADLLIAEGIEPGTKLNPKGEEIFAFAKSDPFMEELQNDPSDRVRALAEARIGAKSSILQTRAETYGYMAQRGPLCVYLKPYGADTLRPAGGDGTNFLNLKRPDPDNPKAGSPIRRSIKAPDDYWLAPIDLSQGEFRLGNYVAEQHSVLDLLRAGGDPYIDIASKFYGEKIYRAKDGDPRAIEMKQKRGCGKQAMLMCLGPMTQILTSNGIKPIIDVCQVDLLWDGVEWVQHSGLIYQGARHVVNVAGVQMTSDHLVWCGTFGWLPAAACLQNANILSRALASGSENLPSPATNSEPRAALLSLLSVVRAMRRNTPQTRTTYFEKKLRSAALVLAKNRVFKLSAIGATQIFVRMKSIVIDCCHASPVYTHAVEPTAKTSGTADAAFKSLISGAAREDVVNFSNISLRSGGGTNPSWKLIASIMRRAMRPVIFALRRIALIKVIDVELVSSMMRSPTYDLACAGPRHRFTVVGDAGPLIVHNCQYGAAAPKFRATARAGHYGPPVDMSLEEAERFVDLYRADNAKVVQYWKTGNRMLARLADGPPLDWGPLHLKNGRIYAPTGQFMHYETLEYHVPTAEEIIEQKLREFEWKGYWRVRTRNGWKKIWGAKLLQNICEFLQQVLVSQAMNRVTRRGYRVLNHPYDELLCLVPRDGHEDRHLEILIGEMKVVPDWLPGFPIDAEGSIGERYDK